MKEISYFKLDNNDSFGFRLYDGVTINDLKSMYLECQLLEIKEITNSITKENREELLKQLEEFPSFKNWLKIQADEFALVSLVKIEE